MKLKCLVILLIVFSAVQVQAFERKTFGLGVIVGEPTGITAKFMLNNNSAIDAGAGWNTSSDNELHIYADYLHHFYDVIAVDKGSLPLYIGAGTRLLVRKDKDDKLGIRLPAGIEYLFTNIALAPFAEIVPVMNLTPDTGLDLEAGFGIRFFF